jgi:hypothetical protein
MATNEYPLDVLQKLHRRFTEANGLQAMLKSNADSVTVLVRLASRVMSLSMVPLAPLSNVTAALGLLRTIKLWTPETEFNAVTVGYGDLDKFVLLVEGGAYATEKVNWFHALPCETDAARALTLNIAQIKDLQQLYESSHERQRGVPDQTKLDGTCVLAASNQLSGILKVVAAATAEKCINMFEADDWGLNDFDDVRLGVSGGLPWSTGDAAAEPLKILIEIYEKNLKPHFDVDAAHKCIEACWKHIDIVEGTNEVLSNGLDLATLYTSIDVHLQRLNDVSATTINFVLLAGIVKMVKTNRPALKRFCAKQSQFLEKHKTIKIHPTLIDSVNTLLTSQKQIL